VTAQYVGIPPCRYGHCLGPGSELDRQGLRPARTMPALITVPDTVDLELELMRSTALDRDLDIEQAKGGITFHAVLVEVDERYPAILALAPDRLRRHLGIAAPRSPRRQGTQGTHLRLGTPVRRGSSLAKGSALQGVNRLTSYSRPRKAKALSASTALWPSAFFTKSPGRFCLIEKG